ncbi:hypothetical protein N665_0679s0014 [Sinapis alba]|nr:hypothetical protein N665_0679s0013 [Sinapis alba]KAF8085138.1 hypothetical protein N665_0679s0014 [Sinapis alba]
MNDVDVSKQIQQMVRFIRQEAEEKANEISVSAEEEFNIEKLQLVEAEKKKIRQDYEKKEKQADEEYAGKANVHAPEVAVDTTIFLPPPPTSSDPHGLHCSGGVVLASRDGKIVCENTLDARLDVAFRMKLPVIRRSLFGQVSA